MVAARLVLNSSDGYRCGSQYTLRWRVVFFDASENRGSAGAEPAICEATYSPTQGPCLNP